MTTAATVGAVPPTGDEAAPPQVKPVFSPPRCPLRETVERFLRDLGVPFINVDDAKRALFAGAKLCSCHFVVYRPTGKN